MTLRFCIRCSQFSPCLIYNHYPCTKVPLFCPISHTTIYSKNKKEPEMFKYRLCFANRLKSKISLEAHGGFRGYRRSLEMLSRYFPVQPTTPRATVAVNHHLWTLTTIRISYWSRISSKVIISNTTEWKRFRKKATVCDAGPHHRLSPTAMRGIPWNQTRYYRWTQTIQQSC